MTSPTERPGRKRGYDKIEDRDYEDQPHYRRETPDRARASYHSPRSAGRDRPARRGPGCLALFRLFIFFALLTGFVVIGFLAFSLLTDAADFVRKPVEDLLEAFGIGDEEPEPVVVSSELIVRGIKETALLQTAEGYIDVTEKVTNPGPDVAFGQLDSKLDIRYKGYVKVGIDISEIADEDIIIDEDGSLTIILPRLRILSCELRDPKVERSECSDAMGLQDCDKIVNAMRDTAFRRAVNDLRKKTEDGKVETEDGRELLQTARDNTEAVIRDFLSAIDPEYEEVTFSYKDEQLDTDEGCRYSE